MRLVPKLSLAFAGLLAAAGCLTAPAIGAPVGYSYAVSGSTAVRPLFNGSAPLSGTAAARTDPATGAFGADLSLAPFAATLVTTGAVPVTASVQVKPTGSMTGVIGGSGLTATLPVRFTLLSASVFGTPIANVSTCQFSRVSSITMRSTSTAFDPSVGGTLAGTFSTTNLSGCQALSGLVSPATVSSGNSMVLVLSRAAPRPARYSDTVFSSVDLTDGIQYAAPFAPNTTTPLPQLLDLYQPAGDTATRRPAIVWVHGGSFIAGNRKEGLVSELARRFALRGYVTVSIDYRLLAPSTCTGASFSSACVLAAINASYDAGAAVRYLRSNADRLGIDPNRIAIGGDSAGAIAAILVGGPHGAPTDPSRVAGVYSISGGSPLDAIFNASSAPMFFWHGTADTIVPYSWAVSNSQLLASLGVYTVLHSVQDAGHVPVAYLDDMDSRARDFFYRVMSLEGAQQ